MSIHVANDNLDIYGRRVSTKELYINGSKVMLNSDNSPTDYSGQIQASSIRFDNDAKAILTHDDVMLTKARNLQPVPKDITLDTLKFTNDSKTYTKDSFNKMDLLSSHLLERQYKLVELDDNVNVSSVNNTITLNRPLRIGNNILDNAVFDRLANARPIDNTTFPSMNVGGVPVTGTLLEGVSQLMSKIDSQTENRIVLGNGKDIAFKNAAGATSIINRDLINNAYIVTQYCDVNGSTGRMYSIGVGEVGSENVKVLNYAKIDKLEKLNDAASGFGNRLMINTDVVFYNSDKTAQVALTYEKIHNYDNAMGDSAKRVIDVDLDWINANATNRNFTNTQFRVKIGQSYDDMKTVPYTFNNCSFVGCDFICSNKYKFVISRSELVNCRFIRETRAGMSVTVYTYEGSTYDANIIEMTKSKISNSKTTSNTYEDTVYQNIALVFDDCELSTCNTRSGTLTFKHSLRAVCCQFRLPSGITIKVDSLSGEVGDCFFLNAIVCINVDDVLSRSLTLNNCVFKGWDRYGSDGMLTPILTGYQDNHHAPVYINNKEYSVYLNSCVFAPEFNVNDYMNKSSGVLSAGSTGHFFGLCSANGGRISSASTVVMIRNCTMDLRGIVGTGRSRILNISNGSSGFSRPCQWISLNQSSSYRKLAGYAIQSHMKDYGGAMGNVNILTEEFCGNDFIL